MLRLARWLLGVVLLAGLGYVAVAVPMGEKSLWEHLKAIAGTTASQEMVEGVKQTADKTLGKIRKPADDTAGPHKGASDDDQLSAEERRKLRRLIRDKLADSKNDS